MNIEQQQQKELQDIFEMYIESENFGNEEAFIDSLEYAMLV